MWGRRPFFSAGFPRCRHAAHRGIINVVKTAVLKSHLAVWQVFIDVALMASTVYHLPGKVGRGRQPNAKGEPLYAKTRPRIGTYLAEPICAKGLNCARKENDAETCNKQNQSFQETASGPDGMLHRDSQSRPHISQRSLFLAPS
jgi:hypothetical protein